MSSRWVDIGGADAVSETAPLSVEIDGVPVVVVRCGAELYAVEERCTHDGESLSGAQVEACQIRPVIGHQLVDREVSLPNHDPIWIGVSDLTHRSDGGVHAGLIDGPDLQPAPFRFHSRAPVRVGRVVPILLVLV